MPTLMPSLSVTAQTLASAGATGRVRKQERADQGSGSIWGHASTWGLLMLLLYFALNGVSPFVNEPTATRAVAAGSAGSVLFERVSKLLITIACMAFALQRHASVRRLSMQTKLITAFPLLALLLAPISQLPTRTISSGGLLLGTILFVYYVMSRYSLDQVLEVMLILGTATMAASTVFALALPQYGLDQMGGHSNAWKGIFGAKNSLGNLALFFLTMAVSYRGRTRFLRSVRVSQIILCLVAIAFSRAATAYLLTAIYIVCLLTLRTLHRFSKKDYFVACLLLLVTFSAAVVVIVAWPDFLIDLLGKDMTLTGRTGIWSAVLDSIAKRPLLGYGYQAFWLGLEGESYRVILAVSWVLAQAQNGFLDITLETGVAGLTIVLLVFAFAFRDAVVCLLRSRDDAQLRAVEWYLIIVILTLLYNLDESFLFEPKHLGSMIFVIACIGLKREWMNLRGRLPASLQDPVRHR
jgi:exopolysaccharide production protein ExoQ